MSYYSLYKMAEFKLDPRLASDCHVIGELNLSLVLLMNNALVPWFILVPKTSKIEIIDLPQIEQHELLAEINFIADFVRSNFKISKLNIAAIGNIVSQLHIHVVGREPSDYCWPNVVWGTTNKTAYNTERVVEITQMLKEQLQN